MSSTDWVAFTRRVGAALAQQRRSRGLSQQQVGEAIGVEPETVSRMETGVISPSLKRLHQLAEVLDCPVEALLGSASAHPHDLINRLSEHLAPLSERERSFVIQQSVSLAAWLAGREPGWLVGGRIERGERLLSGSAPGLGVTRIRVQDASDAASTDAGFSGRRSRKTPDEDGPLP